MMAYNTDDLSLPLEVVSKIITDSVSDLKV